MLTLDEINQCFANPTPENTGALWREYARRKQVQGENESALDALKVGFANYYTPNRVEGESDERNRFAIAAGFEFRTNQPIYRKIDEAAFDSAKLDLRRVKVKRDELIRTKLELAIAVFRTLTPEQLAVVQTFVTETPGAPQIGIYPVETNATGETAPKKRRGRKPKNATE